jgi:hypothetical protein
VNNNNNDEFDSNITIHQACTEHDFDDYSDEALQLALARSLGDIAYQTSSEQVAPSRTIEVFDVSSSEAISSSSNSNEGSSDDDGSNAAATGREERSGDLIVFGKNFAILENR